MKDFLENNLHKEAAVKIMWDRHLLQLLQKLDKCQY